MPLLHALRMREPTMIRDYRESDLEQYMAVWDAASGKELHVLSVHPGIVFSASFSPNGARIVTSSTDGTARVCGESRTRRDRTCYPPSTATGP